MPCGPSPTCRHGISPWRARTKEQEPACADSPWGTRSAWWAAGSAGLTACSSGSACQGALMLLLPAQRRSSMLQSQCSQLCTQLWRHSQCSSQPVLRCLACCRMEDCGAHLPKADRTPHRHAGLGCQPALRQRSSAQLRRVHSLRDSEQRQGLGPIPFNDGWEWQVAVVHRVLPQLDAVLLLAQQHAAYGGHHCTVAQQAALQAAQRSCRPSSSLQQRSTILTRAGTDAEPACGAPFVPLLYTTLHRSWASRRAGGHGWPLPRAVSSLKVFTARPRLTSTCSLVHAVGLCCAQEDHCASVQPDMCATYPTLQAVFWERHS